MTATPPLPPEIAAQQQPSPASLFSKIGQPGGGTPDPLSLAQSKLGQLEEWASGMAPVLNQLDPALTTFLVPIAQAAKAMAAEIISRQQKATGPSQPVQGTVAPTVPGNMPDARPAM